MAAEKRNPMSADLLRQRRNLLVTSLILIAINLAGAKLKSDVSVLGAAIEFSNPERIVWGVWILWAYFLIRYWQYLSEVPDKGFQKGMEIWIFERYQSIHTDPNSQPSLTWTSNMNWTLMDGTYIDGRWVTKPMSIKGWKKAAWSTRAFLSNAIRTPRFTDYLLPFLVALLPLVITAGEYFASVDFISIWKIIRLRLFPVASD